LTRACVPQTQLPVLPDEQSSAGEPRDMHLGQLDICDGDLAGCRDFPHRLVGASGWVTNAGAHTKLRCYEAANVGLSLLATSLTSSSCGGSSIVGRGRGGVDAPRQPPLLSARRHGQRSTGTWRSRWSMSTISSQLTAETAGARYRLRSAVCRSPGSGFRSALATAGSRRSNSEESIHTPPHIGQVSKRTSWPSAWTSRVPSSGHCMASFLPDAWAVILPVNLTLLD
jgi:hypothetical protein